MKGFDKLPVIVTIVIVVVLILTLVKSVADLNRYRSNAMDLCLWHARVIFDDDPSDLNQRWMRVHSGRLECPFCGQLHDKNWISRNAWDSQINAFKKRKLK